MECKVLAEEQPFKVPESVRTVRHLQAALAVQPMAAKRRAAWLSVQKALLPAAPLVERMAARQREE